MALSINHGLNISRLGFGMTIQHNPDTQRPESIAFRDPTRPVYDLRKQKGDSLLKSLWKRVRQQPINRTKVTAYLKGDETPLVETAWHKGGLKHTTLKDSAIAGEDRARLTKDLAAVFTRF